jgi:hypothetical protein
MKASLSANDETVPTIPSSPQHLVGQDGAGNPVTTLDHQRVVPMSPPLPATLHGQACANTSDRPHALTLAESHSLHRV